MDKLKKELLKPDDERAEYDALAKEFSIVEALIRARNTADMTQVEVAEIMHTSKSYVAKLEGGLVSASMKALQRYADATGLN